MSVTKVIIPLSGGIDSTVLAAWAVEQFDQVHAVIFEHALGAGNGAEVQHAKLVADNLQLAHTVLRLPMHRSRVRAYHVALTVGVAFETALALRWDGIAVSEREPLVVEAIRAMGSNGPASTSSVLSDLPLGVAAPLSGKSRADVLKLAQVVEAPLGLTWSCYLASLVHCGRCDGCIARREAFSAAHLYDQTVYE